MNLVEMFSSAFSNVFSYKMRSLLTMLGIIIGISSVIMIMSVGSGVQETIFSELDSFNMNSLEVMPRNFLQGGQGIFTMEDLEVVRQLPNVKDVSPVLQVPNQRLQLRSPNEATTGHAFGLSEAYHNVEVINMLYGRFITEQDVINNSFVAVISPEVSIDVFGFVDSVGQRLEVEGVNGRYNLTVIGVLDIEQNAIGAQTPLNNALFIIPVTTASIIVGNPGYVESFSVAIEDPEQSTGTASQITRLLNMRHNREDAFIAMSISSFMDSVTAILSGVTGFIIFVAAISLFVGGVGVMNIMMVTVTERTREIGIRKSLGATSNTIKLQFVLESAILTSVGGIIGVILGIAGALALSSIISFILLIDIIPTVEPSVALLAVGISMLVGIVFGVYPASKAAKLDPVEALRYE